MTPHSSVPLTGKRSIADCKSVCSGDAATCRPHRDTLPSLYLLLPVAPAFSTRRPWNDIHQSWSPWNFLLTPFAECQFAISLIPKPQLRPALQSTSYGRTRRRANRGQPAIGLLLLRHEVSLCVCCGHCSATGTSRNCSDECIDQSYPHGGDRVWKVTFRPQGGSPWVDDLWVRQAP
jgi:hypothetical protein